MRMNGLAVMACALIFCLALVCSAAANPTVAVFDFDIGTTETARLLITTEKGTSSGQFSTSRQTSLLTNKLITQIANSRAVEVVERQKISAIMSEARLSQSDLAYPDRAIKLGRLLGADYMVFGSISMLDPRISIKKLPYNAGLQKTISLNVGANMRMVKTETGKIEAAADLKSEMTSDQINPLDGNDIPQKFQDEVFSDLAAKLASRIVDSVNPIKVANFSGDTVYLARASLPAGNRYEIVKLGEEIRDPDTNDLLGQTEERIAIVQVTAGLQKMSKATVSEWIVEEKVIPKGSICRRID